MGHSVDNATASSVPVEIFYSYSHKDEKLRDRLEKHLSILKREGVIAGWHDRKITGGNEWAGQIDEHLNSAHIILLLVSADFVASDYCYDVEVKRAMERHENGGARVIPVILRPCVWNEAPFGKLQGLPRDAKPVTRWSNREEAFTDVALGIRKVVTELRASGSAAVAVRIVSSEAHALPAIWNVPQRDRNFTGREELLNDLHKSLASGMSAALTQAIVGLGGVGKTRTAMEYCYRHAREYRLVWWMASEEPGRLAADYAALAQKLKLPEKDDRYQGVVVRAVRDALSRSGGWLLVFDNARASDDIEAYLPAGNGHVIVTSRNPAFRKIAGVLPVAVMTLPEAVEFLMKHAQGDANEAEALATELGRLPLALAQAGAYIDKHGSTFGRYLEMFRAHQKELLVRGAQPDDVTVATTWELAFSEVERKSEEAAQLMHLCAFLAPDDIWQGLLKDGAKFLPTPLAVAVRDDFRWDEAVAALRRYSLLDVRHKTFSVHRLVQAVERERLEVAGKKEWAAAAVQVVNATFLYDLNDIKTWTPCARLLPHALLSVEHAEGLHIGLESSGRLLEQVGLYLLGRAKFGSAKSVLERALTIDEAAYGPDHPKVAEVVSNLANVLKLQGDRVGARAQYERARAHYERALKNDEAAHGPDHLIVARDASKLGTMLKEEGDLAGARMQFERTVKIDEAVYGLDHPDVAKDVIDLGLVLQRQGDLGGARMQFERALRIDEAAHGPDHPDVARDVNYLGDVLLEQADWVGARAHYERALKIDEAAYGQDHPTVATERNNLGYLLQEQGDLAGARAQHERAVKIDEAAYGPDHPDVARDVNDLGLVLQEQGDLPGAWANYERALKIDEAAYGLNHPKVAREVSNLGSVLKEQGDLAGARMQFERALKINEAAYGVDHAKVAMSIWWLGVTFQDIGDLVQARAHLERALIIFEKVLRPDHPNARLVRENLESLGGP